jgi:hypothetical protein
MKERHPKVSKVKPPRCFCTLLEAFMFDAGRWMSEEPATCIPAAILRAYVKA